MKSIQELIKGLLKHDTVALARAITLVESRSAQHYEQAHDLIAEVLPHTGESIRIAITGVPGAGKSTLIEKLGLYLLEKQQRVAVLAIDPSSSISGGSILGDKTRMEHLSRSPHAFIRPTPSTGALGGVGDKTREAILLCEAAGFDIIIVETLGVGQGELQVRTMVDFFLLMQIAGAGDELQGLKKGIIEIADAIVINKADGQNEMPARQAKEEIERALHYLTHNENDWKVPVLTCSALNNEGVDEIWQVISSYINKMKVNNTFAGNRNAQKKDWLFKIIDDRFRNIFFKQADIMNELKKAENEVLNDKILPIQAADKVIDLIKRKYNLK